MRVVKEVLFIWKQQTFGLFGVHPLPELRHLILIGGREAFVGGHKGLLLGLVEDAAKILWEPQWSLLVFRPDLNLGVFTFAFV